MALLTAEDILNKKFSATKFREGYDVEEVDDFLDEVVNTLRVVSGENEELKAKLAALRDARAKARADLEAAQKDLQEVLTPRQEAVLVAMGMIE